jgi:glycosyltransferase involved in cell wall biosynthesis
MRTLFFAAKVKLLSRLPVSMARSRLKRAASAQPAGRYANAEKQMLVDVSVIIGSDARTGIQRVVRSLLLQLLIAPPAGYRVRPVFATRRHGYCYAPHGFGLPGAPVTSTAGALAVKAGPGDIYLGLDLAAHLLPRHKVELAQWKRSGTKIHVIVYDLLPVLHPQWFNPKTTRNFRRWLNTIAIFADSIICISTTVKAELDGWLSQRYFLSSGAIPMHVIALGANIEASAPSRGLPSNLDQLLRTFGDKPTVLMVGTLEPRKGHSQVLAAFEQLWQRGRDINLVIVGKPGWKTEALQQVLRTHPQRAACLHWLDNASDELLELLYTRCSGVIVASHAEGFGLPLIEAMHHAKPVLARDIPVFREVGGNFITFFPGESTEKFMTDIELWLANMAMPRALYEAPRYTWQDSAGELLECLGLPLQQAALGQAGCGHLPLILKVSA